MENAILGDEIVGRIAERSRARRHPDYDDEVRRLLAAALAVMSRSGTGTAPKVADIVAEAGLSNVAFYRHFPSKEAMVDALVEDGTLRLRDYLAHQMGKEGTPAGKVRRWVEGVMAQAGGDIAATTLAVLSNGGATGVESAGGRHRASVPLAALLHEPFGAIGGEDAALAASLVTHAMLGRLSDHQSARTQPDAAEMGRLIRFALLSGGVKDTGPAGAADVSADGAGIARKSKRSASTRRRQ
jgi:AcrR family transcriptional regulator